MGDPEGLVNPAMPASAPRYELRVRAHAAGDTDYTIWQLARFGLRPRPSANHKKRGYSLREESPLTLGFAVPNARAHAQPRQHARGRRGH